MKEEEREGEMKWWKKKDIREMQRAYYEQRQTSKVQRTNRPQHSGCDKALKLNYLKCCALNEAQ